MSRAAPALLMALAALVAGCGSDRADRELHDRVQRDCAALVGQTLDDAGALMPVSGLVASACASTLGPVGASDACPGAPGPYTEPVCQVAYELCALGTSLCSSGPLGGCAYACEVRVAAATPAALSGASVICATRFVSGQPFGLLSGRSCQ